MGGVERRDKLVRPEPLIEASRLYRDALLQAHRELSPHCSTYQVAARVTDAIDDLLAEVTGQSSLFPVSLH